MRHIYIASDILQSPSYQFPSLRICGSRMCLVVCGVAPREGERKGKQNQNRTLSKVGIQDVKVIPKRNMIQKGRDLAQALIEYFRQHPGTYVNVENLGHQGLDNIHVENNGRVHLNLTPKFQLYSNVNRNSKEFSYTLTCQCLHPLRS